MRYYCPTCGGRIKLAQAQNGAQVIIPQDALVLLQELAEAYPLRLTRILEILHGMPEAEVERLLRETEDYLGR